MIADKGCEDLFFLIINGKQYNQIFRKIKEVARVNGFTNILPSPPSKYHIALSTEAAKQLDDCDLRKVARHLSHSEETSSR